VKRDFRCRRGTSDVLTQRINGSLFPLDYDAAAPLASADDKGVARGWPIEGREVKPLPMLDHEKGQE
jgi:hypothetical protein